MTQLLTACKSILDQLEDMVQQIDEKDFCKPSGTLSHSTMGQHLRHTLEFFICLKSGFEIGLVNYDLRNHDKLLEGDKFIAMASLREIQDFVSNHTEDKMLKLEMAYERDCENRMTVETNYWRELVYNIEHAVHHMAIMKIGIREVAPYVNLSADFGIAVSTLRYKEAGAAGAR